MGSVWERQEEYKTSVHSKNMKSALDEHILKKQSHKFDSDCVMTIDSEVRADPVSTDEGLQSTTSLHVAAPRRQRGQLCEHGPTLL